VVAAGALALVYVLTLTSTDPIDLVVGAALGALLAGSVGGRLRLRLDPRCEVPSAPVRAAFFPVFVVGVLIDVTTGTWDVALRVMHLRRLEHPGIVLIPIGDRSERGVAVSALATTLSPGSVLIDIDWETRHLVLHVIDASDPEDVRRRLQSFYDRYQRKVFP
jgi:multicomponent Na+:H+ antiporter subunit E